MAKVIIILEKASTLVRGVLRNALIEPHANVFVGTLDAKQLAAAIDMLNQQNASGVVCASSRSNDLGFRFMRLGIASHRTLTEIDGIQLVKIHSVAEKADAKYDGDG